MCKEGIGSAIHAHGVNRQIIAPFITPGLYLHRLVPARTPSDSSF